MAIAERGPQPVPGDAAPGPAVGPGRVDVLASDVDGRVVVLEQPGEVEPDRRWGQGSRRRERRTPGALAVMLVVAGWPLWWLLGATQLVFPLLAVVLLLALRGRGGIKVPDGFWIWVLFLLLVVLSAVALDVDASGTVTSEGIGRYFAFGLRLANYLSITLLMLYIGNLSEAELPRRRVIRWIAALGVWSLALGVVAVLLPDLQFVNPVSRLLPAALSDGGITQIAQVQPVLGDPTPRPAAPFAFTNAWGNNTALLLVWMVVLFGVVGTRRSRLWLVAMLLVGSVPVIYSLNRGMWLGLILAGVVVAVRLALRGRTLVLVASTGVAMLAAVAFLLSPLSGLVSERLDAGHSNAVRGSLAETALDTARQSPVIGFGSTRETQGSDDSIAIGPTSDCPRCGARNIGSTGQLTLLLVAQGFAGVLLYVGFLARSVLAYRHDLSPIGIAGTAVVVMTMFFGLFYSALTMPLCLTFMSIGLLWRNAQLRAAQEAR